MYTNAQNQQILRILVKALDLNSFVTNQYLISRLVPQGSCYLLPISVFMAFPEFITMQVTEEDIIDSAKQLQGIYSQDNFLYIPYQIFPSMLVMKEFCQFANPTEILSYITSLLGTAPIAVHKMTNNIVVAFQNIDECIIFWRGTKYYPFQGAKYIECQIFSQLFMNYPISSLKEEENILSVSPIPTEQIELQNNQKHDSQFNDKYHSSNQSYTQKRSPRRDNLRYTPKQKQFTGDGNSSRPSQNQRVNRSRDQQHRQQQPQSFLRDNPKIQPNIPAQYKYKPQISSRSNSQPLVLQKPPQPPQVQHKSQQQPQLSQSQQSPQQYNKGHRQTQQQQQQQNHYQPEKQEQQPPPPPQEQQQTNTMKSSKPRKYNFRSKKQNQKK